MKKEQIKKFAETRQSFYIYEEEKIAEHLDALKKALPEALKVERVVVAAVVDADAAAEIDPTERSSERFFHAFSRAVSASMRRASVR